MNQILHHIEKEFHNLKSSEVYTPEINGEQNISGFNTLIAALFSANRKLKGTFTTKSYLEKNKLSYLKDAPIINFLEYEINGTMIFLKEMVHSLLPNFNPQKQEDIQILEDKFKEQKIIGFASENRPIIEKDFGKIYEIDFGRNILNYKKVEAVPNEFVEEKRQIQVNDLSEAVIKTKNEIEKAKYDNFDEGLQYFFFLLNTYGQANTEMLKQFDLHEIETGIDLFVKANNNYILARDLNISMNNNIYQKK